MRSANNSYVTIQSYGQEESENTPWYWRLIALAASWMILGGYLILPGLYAKDAQLRFTEAVLSVFVVALLTAGYSFTALLCFACRNKRFQAEGVFLPALASSVLGLISIAYNFLSSRAYQWSTSATAGTVLSAAATLTYAVLCIYTFRRLTPPVLHHQPESRTNPWSEQSYYTNFVPNMYPTAVHPPPPVVYTEDDRVNQQMALLLHKSDSRPSPDANSTFHIDLPEDPEQSEREAHSQELVGTPVAPAHAEWNRGRANSRPSSLGEQQAWLQWQDRGRSAESTQGKSTRGQSSHSRNVSREERRREIELGEMRST